MRPIWAICTKSGQKCSRIGQKKYNHGCKPAQLAAQGGIPHLQCKHHGQDASDAARAPCCCPTARGAGRTVTSVEGTGPGPASTSSPRPHPQGRAAALVGGRRDITLATTEAAGGGDARPGGKQSSLSESSKHGGGRSRCTTTGRRRGPLIRCTTPWTTWRRPGTPAWQR